MLSVIICSSNKELLDRVSENIIETIGIFCEIVSINNQNNYYSITQAYNLGAKKAKYDNLLFVHEDIAFKTFNWGQDLINILNIIEIGMVGVSGAVYKSEIPSTWSMIPSEYYRINALQKWSNGEITKHIKKEKDDDPFSEVVVIDGVFMAMRKNVWQEFPFDEKHIKGFHLYDLDESIKIREKYKLVVTHHLLLEHFSEGAIDKTWIKVALEYHKKHKAQLPISLYNLKPEEEKQIRYHAASALSFLLIKNNMKLIAIKYILKCFSISLVNRTNRNLISFFIKRLF